MDRIESESERGLCVPGFRYCGGIGCGRLRAKGAALKKAKKECLGDVFEREAAQAWVHAWEREVPGGESGLDAGKMSLQKWRACLAWGRTVATDLNWEYLERELGQKEGRAPWMPIAIDKSRRSSKAIAGDPWASVGMLALTMEVRRRLFEGIKKAAAIRGAESQRRENGEEKARFSAMSVEESVDLRAFAERSGMVERLMGELSAVGDQDGTDKQCLAVWMALENQDFDHPEHVGAGCALEALKCLGLMAQGLSPAERTLVVAAWGDSAGELLGAPTGGGMDWLCASLGTASARRAVDAAQGALLGEAASAVDGEMSCWAMAGDGSGAKAAVGACVLQLVLSDVLSGQERKEAEDWVQALGLLLRCMGQGARRSVLDQWEAVGPEERCVAWAVCIPEERVEGAEFYEAAARCDVAPWAQTLATQILAEKAARELGASVRAAACAPKEAAPGAVRL